MTTLLLNSVTFNRPHVLLNKTEQYPGNVWAHPNPFQAETITFAFSDNHVIKFSVPKDPNGVHLGPCLFGKYNNSRFLFMLIHAAWNYEDSQYESPMLATFEITSMIDEPVQYFRHHFNLMCEYLAEHFPLMKMRFSELYDEVALTYVPEQDALSLLVKQSVTGIWNHLISWHLLGGIKAYWIHTSLPTIDTLMTQLAIRQPVEWTTDLLESWMRDRPVMASPTAMRIHLTKDVSMTLHWLLRTAPVFTSVVGPNKHVTVTQTTDALSLITVDNVSKQSTYVGKHYVVLSSKYTMDSLTTNPIIIDIETEEYSYD